MTINYTPFPSDNTNNTLAKGKDFKICFKATNCYDYNARIVDFYDNSCRLGMQINAQSANFYLSDASYTNT
jgi:hypothetical protein